MPQTDGNTKAAYERVGWFPVGEHTPIRKKPKIRGGIIYSLLDPEAGYMITGDHFLPTWDSTDHFHFVCGECKTVADVLEVKALHPYGSGIKCAIFFYLGCPACGNSGQRKIYLDRRPEAAGYQVTHVPSMHLDRPHAGVDVIFYAREAKPKEIKHFVPEE